MVLSTFNAINIFFQNFEGDFLRFWSANEFNIYYTALLNTEQPFHGKYNWPLSRKCNALAVFLLTPQVVRLLINPSVLGC